MSDDAKLLGEIERGARARALLDSPVYLEALKAVRDGIYEQWAKSPIRDIEGQTSLRLMLKLLDDLEGNINRVATTGKLAAAQREHELSMKERAKKLARGLLDRV